MFGGYPPTAIGYPPTAIGYTPTAIGYTPTAIGYTPTAISYPPTAISYPPTAISYPPAAIIGRIGHSEFFLFFIMATPGLSSVCVCVCFGGEVFQGCDSAPPTLSFPSLLQCLPRPHVSVQACRPQYWEPWEDVYHPSSLADWDVHLSASDCFRY